MIDTQRMADIFADATVMTAGPVDYASEFIATIAAGNSRITVVISPSGKYTLFVDNIDEKFFYSGGDLCGSTLVKS